MSAAAELAKRRRFFIRGRIEATGKASFKEIRAAFPGTNRASIHSDYNALRKADPELEMAGGRNSRYLLSLARGNVNVKASRQERNKEGKAMIARAAAGLIAGHDGKCWHGVDEEGFQAQKALPTSDALLNCLERTNRDLQHFDTVQSKLMRAWDRLARSIALDAGTTTEAISQCIKDLAFPQPRISILTAYTNSRGIFDVLGRPECQVKTVMIGGSQERKTDSVCGSDAQKCLAAWDPSFDLVIVGATVIDLNTGNIGCHTEVEANMKRSLLIRGTVRIVVADATKFEEHPIGMVFAVGLLNTGLVDLVITDEIDAARLAKLRLFGVPVLAASELLR